MSTCNVFKNKKEEMKSNWEWSKCVYFIYTLQEFFLIFVTETISRTDEGQPRPKYIFNKCGTNIYFFLLYRDLVHHHHRILKKGLYPIYKVPCINMYLIINLENIVVVLVWKLSNSDNEDHCFCNQKLFLREPAIESNSF